MAGRKILLLDGGMRTDSKGVLQRNDYAGRTIRKFARKAGVLLDEAVIMEKLGTGRIAPLIDKYDSLIVGGAGLVDTIRDEHAIGLLNDGKVLKSGDVTGFTMEAIDYCAEKGIPLLGICSGMQIIARYAGEEVSTLPKEEFGFVKVRLTQEGKAHMLFKGLPAELQVPAYHEYGIVSPKKVQVLAKNDVSVQALALEGTAVAGVQFHPEFAFVLEQYYREDKLGQKGLLGRVAAEAKRLMTGQPAIRLPYELAELAVKPLLNFLSG